MHRRKEGEDPKQTLLDAEQAARLSQRECAAVLANLAELRFRSGDKPVALMLLAEVEGLKRGRTSQ